MDHLTRRGFTLLCFDVFFIALSFHLSAHINLGNLDIPYLVQHTIPLACIGAIYLGSYYLFDLHYPWRDYRHTFDTLKIVGANIVPFILAGAFFYFQNSAIGRSILLVANFILIPLIVVSRWVYSFINGQKFLTRQALILGTTKAGTFIHDRIEELPPVGINIVGFLREGTQKPEHATYSGVPLFGCETDLKSVIERNKIDLIILATSQPTSDKLNEVLIRLRQKGVYLISMPALYESLTGEIPYEFIDSSWLLEACLRQRKFGTLKAKRIFDIIFSIIGIIVTSPVMLAAALIIKLTSKGPVFFVQERLGQDAVPYKLIKFRTMIQDAEKETGAVMATQNDVRTTGVGRFFRKFRIDELPQFFNVLKGEMSLIGPRPERETFIRQFEKKIPFYSLRLAVKPGLTGWAQVKFRYASNFDDIKEKFRYDLYYLKNLSFVLDIQIVIMTIRVILSGFGGR